MAFRREKGLCYNCDDKWSPNHRCKGRILLFIADDLPPDDDDPGSVTTNSGLEGNDGDSEPAIDTSFPHANLHAMFGLPSSETFRIYGTIKNARLTILIDSGSTHNFLQPRVAQFLHLPVETTQPLRVLVGNGSVLDCNQRCTDTQLSIQGHSFPVTFHLLHISGADIVLGIDWLKQFGPVTTDYTSFIMRFTHLG